MATATASLKRMYIDGKWVEASNGGTLGVINPATEEVLAEVSEASADDVDAAVRAARTAYTRVWSRMSGADRGKYLFRIARLVQERARELAVAESLDNGKPIKESRDVDVPLVAAWFFYYAGWADKLDHAGLGAGPRAHGVAAQVIPSVRRQQLTVRLVLRNAGAAARSVTLTTRVLETNSPVLALADLPDGLDTVLGDSGSTLSAGEEQLVAFARLLVREPAMECP